MSFADELRTLSSNSTHKSKEALMQTAEIMHKCIQENAEFSARKGLRSISGFPANKYYDDYQFFSDSTLKLFIGSDEERRAERNKYPKPKSLVKLRIGESTSKTMLPYYFVYFETMDDAQYAAQHLLKLLRADGFTQYSAKIVPVHDVILVRKGGIIGDIISYEETGKIFYAVRVSVSW